MGKNNKNFIPDEIYKKILDFMPIICVDIVFLNKEKNKTLLCKRNNKPAKNVYFTIGGRLCKGENTIDRAIKQAKAELNLTIDRKKIFQAGIIEEPWSDSIYENISSHDICIFYGYILEDEDKDIKLDNQHDEYKWFDINDISLHSKVKERIEKTLLKIKNHEK